MSGKGAKDELKVLCKNKDIPIEGEIHEVDEGWEGKPKGCCRFCERVTSLILKNKTKGIIH